MVFLPNNAISDIAVDFSPAAFWEKILSNQWGIEWNRQICRIWRTWRVKPTFIPGDFLRRSGGVVSLG
jgi:hypothetical protein